MLAALERWNVEVDDSGGDLLADTPAGVFAQLVAHATVEGLPPVSLLALLKHPLTRLGRAEGSHTRAIATILFHPSFPVDIRHNAKIFREQLAAWAARQLR